MLPQLIKAFDHIRELMVFYEPDFRVVWLNQAAVRWAGKPPGELVGRRCFEVFYGRTDPCAGCLVQKVVTTGKAVESEHHGADGRIWAVRAYPVWSETGALKGVMEISLDLSAVKAVQAALKDRERRYYAVLQNTLDGICVVSADQWKIEEINPALTSLLGCRHSPPVGFSLLDFAEGDPQALERHLMEVLRTKRGKVLETRLASRDGDLLDVELSLNPLALQGHDRIIVVCRDVRERNRALTERLRAQKLESLAVMAEGMAHDFNNILAGVVGNLSLAKIDADPQSRLYHRLCAAEKACARAEEITRRLLTFADGGDPVRRSMQAHEFLSTKVLPALNALPVHVSAELPEDLPSVCIDADLLSHAFVDLATDVLIRKGAASLHVEGRCDPGPVPGGPVGNWPRSWIRIALNAPNVHLTPHEVDRLFDPYANKNFCVGRGLGPCAAYAVVRRHGGHIQAQCEPATGTRLIVVLPADGDSRGQGEGEVLEHRMTSLHQGRLLIMDDERIVRETLGEILRLKGYEVALAADGREAVALYTARLKNGDPFDAVILDLTVRGGPGAVEVLEELRRVDPNVRAFVSSGYTLDPVMIDYLRYGFCGVAPKPFHYDELALDIQRIIGRQRKPLP